MKIAHFPSGFLPTLGGAEIAVHNVVLQQYRAGHEVTLISPYVWRTEAYYAVPYKVVPLFPRSMNFVVKVMQCRYGTRWLVTAQLAFYQWIYKFDVWHIHVVYPAGILAIPMLKRMRLPSVLTCQGGDIQTLPQIGYGARLDPAVDREVVKAILAFDRVVAISDDIRSEFLSIGVAPDKIRDIPNGADAVRIQSLPVDRHQVRTRLGWPADKMILLTVGRNHPKKGYKFIPEIIKHVAAVRQDFLWVIVGRATEPIREMAQGLGVGDYLQVLPQIGHKKKHARHQEMLTLPSEALIEIYKATDIFVLPSMLEGLALVSVEAMAARLPVVTTDAPGCRDVVEHGVTGLISPVGDTWAMAQNILRLMADPLLGIRLGRNGKTRSIEHEWQHVAAQYYEVYEELVSSRPAATAF